MLLSRESVCGGGGGGGAGAVEKQKNQSKSILHGNHQHYKIATTLFGNGDAVKYSNFCKAGAERLIRPFISTIGNISCPFIWVIVILYL